MKRKSIDKLTASAPGRLCLFGEHQDYLQLPVIPCAISLRLTIEGARRADTRVELELPDIGMHVSFSLLQTFPYVLERDYFRSGINVLRRNGYTFSGGFSCEVNGKIPINAGASSSSALVVAWVNFLARMSEQNKILSAEESARYAYEAEVLEFAEPGGMMDHISTSYGGVVFLHFVPAMTIQQVQPQMKTFILGDSKEPKATKEILSRVKNKVLAISNRISTTHAEFSLQEVSLDQATRFKEMLLPEEFSLLLGTIRNRDITLEAQRLLSQIHFDEQKFGQLLTEHQTILRETLGISTPKIDRMIEAALDAGAVGAKINGSGGGGCMFAYAPDNPETIAQAVERAGGKAYLVHADHGIKIHSY